MGGYRPDYHPSSMSESRPITCVDAPTPGNPGEMPTRYRPSDHETRIWDLWERSGAFTADPARVLRGDASRFSVVIPPPNVTDRLHLGHALNNTLQDVLVRVRRMMGFETLWMPGTDHAGIATQAVVERRLRTEGRLAGPLREAMRRDEFVALVQSYKDEYEATITAQLKAMGCSCDWKRQRFTMDGQCARAVSEAFFRLFRDGLIYRGKRLVNWDPVLQTAVADDECEDVVVDGNFYYLRYPLVHPRPEGQDAVPVTWSELRARGWPEAEDAEHADDAPAWVTVATTRPETYLGDTAVAVNPRDPRAPALRGLSVELPLVGRIIPVIEDSYVVMPAGRTGAGASEPEDPKATYATGFLKVTPAHDPNDYEIGLRHRLPLINIFAPDATISDRHGWSDPDELRGAHVFLGLSREDARRKVVQEFRARGLCEKVVPYRHSVKQSDRSKAVIEPYLSDQWYVKVTDDRLAGAALRAMGTAAKQPANAAGERRSKAADRGAGDGGLQFHPERYAKTYQSWHENIRDWCISRQLWWGHRIPVWWSPLAKAPGVSSPDASGDDIRKPLRDALKAWRDQNRIAIVEAPMHVAPRHGVNDPPGGFVQPINCICVRDDNDTEVIQVIERYGFHRDDDVLDTWFSSALWPMSTMGWPEDTDLLRAFNPTDVLCTSREIITLWVSRMVMFERYLMPADWPGPRGPADPRTLGDGAANRAGTLDDMGRGLGPLPFRDVFIHAMIQDGEGRKMSKSLGNGVDPLDIIASHGADAMRFTLCHMATHTQDVRMPVEKDPSTGRNTSPKFDLGRNFCTKLWNAARFALSLLPSRPRGAGVPPGPSPTPISIADLRLPDRWMLSRLAATVAEVDRTLGGYEFSVYAQRMYDLTWRDFCDWYLEAIKPTVASDAAQRAVLAHALGVIIRLLHPMMPFVTEAIWERLRHVEPDPIAGLELGPARRSGLLCTAGWPAVSTSLRDERAEQRFDRLRSLVTAIREVRATHQVPPRRRVTLHTSPAIEAECRAADTGGMVATLAGLDAIVSSPPTVSAVTFMHEGVECRLSNLADEVDAGAERSRLVRRLAELDRSIATLEARLANPGYVERAPPAMVRQTRDQLAKARAERDAASASLERA